MGISVFPNLSNAACDVQTSNTISLSFGPNAAWYERPAGLPAPDDRSDRGALTQSKACCSLLLVIGSNQPTVWQRLVRQPKNLWLRKAFFQVHLFSGVAVGL